MCLSGEFHNVVIFSSKIEVQFGICINWCSHEFMSRLGDLIKGAVSK